MKTITKLLLSAMMMAAGCSMAGAQDLIYSNSFNGQTVTLNGTAPTVANSVAGGVNNAVWICTYTNNAVPGAGTVYADGTIATNQGCALLPFTPQSGAVYYLSGSITVPSPMPSQVEIGFTEYDTQEHALATVRFNDNPPNGYAWMFNREGANDNFFAGPKTSVETGSANLMPGAGTYTWEVILNTLGAKWTTSAFINGVQLGTNVVYSANPPIAYCGIGQATFINDSVSGIQWNYFTLATALHPLIFQQPVSASVSEGSAFTNSMTVLADTNGGPLFYQWYTNGVAIDGATNSALVLDPVVAGDAGTNYYAVATNNYGAITSAVVSLSVYTSPVLLNSLPMTYTNPMTLYGGGNVDGTNYVGSTPTFSVVAAGAAPLYYQWLTNGVSVGWATNTSFTFTNCQMSSPTNFTCIVSNYLGATTNTWSAAYIAAPLAPFPQLVLGLNPAGYWRLNETGNDNGVFDPGSDPGANDGLICNDYAGGNNGVYTNLWLGPGQTGYDPATDPTETSAQFGEADEGNDFGDSDANSIAGINFATPTNTSAAFSVEAWVAGYPGQTYDAGIVTLGWGGGGEQFDLDTGANDPAHDFRFLVRDASGTVHIVNSTVAPSGVTSWYDLVGVVDEITNHTVSLYVDGQLVGTTPIAAGSGILTATNALMGEPSFMSIGARMGSATTNYNFQFYGNMNDVAVFNYALSPAQVSGLYVAGGGIISPYFVPPVPLTNFVVTVTNTTLTIPAIVAGGTPMGYYWTNLTTDAVLASGATNSVAALNASLNYPGLTTNWWGDVVELVVTNAFGSTNWFVTLSAPPLPPETLGYTNSILYTNAFDGGQATIGGTAATGANSLVGGTNTVWICTYTNNASVLSGTVFANGTLGTNMGCALMPFKPEPGYIYTMTASLTALSGMADWVAMGFTEYGTQTNNPGYSRFTDDPPIGYGWMYILNSSGVFEPGPRTSGTSSSIQSVPLPSTTPVTLQIVLNTVTNNGWVASAYVNGFGIGTNVYSSNPPIGFAGIGQNQFSSSPPTGIQWNYWTLSQVAAGGVPPYLIPPSPPTTAVLQPGMPLTISATAFGSGPLGYYWTDVNGGTNLASGVTNTMAPLDATLTVPSVPGSWNGDQLELTVTNAYGTNTTLFSLSVISLNPTNIVATVTNNNLDLTWPVDHIGWQLQAQTNKLGVGLSTNWVNYDSSTGTNQVVIPINITNGAVFYRLIYTP